MGATHFSGPVFSAGGFIGEGGGEGNLPLSGGETFFVDPNQEEGDGSSPDSPFQSLQDAVDAAEGGRGDTIYVAPGTYDENIVITGKDYLSLVGMIGGYGRPDIAPAAGIAVHVDNSQGVVLKNLRMVSADDHVCHIEGNGFRIENCVIDGDGNGATDAGLLLQGDGDDDSYTASEGLVLNCLFRNLGGFGILFKGADAPVGVGSTHCHIYGCRFIDNTGADIACEDNAAADATYSVQDVVIERCMFAEPKNKATWVDFTTSNGGVVGGQTGMFVDCFFNDDTVDTTAVKATGTGFGFVGCHSMDGEIDGSGLD